MKSRAVMDYVDGACSDDAPAWTDAIVCVLSILQVPDISFVVTYSAACFCKRLKIASK